MRAWNSVCLGLVLVVWIVSPGYAKEKEDGRPGKGPPATVPAKRPAVDRGEARGAQFSAMVEVLGLDADQKKKLSDAIEAKMVALKTLRESESGRKLRELQKELPNAKTPEQTEQIKQQINALREEMRKVMAEQDAKILSVLTPEQQSQWASHRLALMTLKRYGRVGLSEDQKEQIRELSRKHATTDAAQMRAKQAGFFKQINENVLTEEQRRSLGDARGPDKEPRPPRVGQGAPGKKVKGGQDKAAADRADGEGEEGKGEEADAEADD